MMHKQVSWRRSNQALFLFSLLLVPTHSYSMGYFFDRYFEWKHLQKNQGLRSKPSFQSFSATEQASGGAAGAAAQASGESAEGSASAAAAQDYAFVPEMTAAQKKEFTARGETFHGRTLEELEEVYADAPEDVRDIVDHLQSPTAPDWRSACLVGPSGTGKTTVMLAVPYMARWHWKFLSGPELSGQYRNQAKERLKEELEFVIASKQKTVVCMDELNRLLENFESSSHDTETTASYLWTFLDKHKRNPNFFFIGTMNRDNKLPDPVKHRFGASTIYFKRIPPEKLLVIFKRILQRNPHIIVADECDDEFLGGCLTTLDSEGVDHSPRDYENMSILSARFARRDDRASAVRTVKCKHINAAITALTETYNHSGKGKEELTEDEKRDFSAVQSRIIEIKLQCAQKVQAGANASINPGGLIAAAMNPMAGIAKALESVNIGANVGRAPGLDLDEAIEIIEQEFTPDQIALYRRVMKIDDDKPLIQRGRIDRFKQFMRGGSGGGAGAEKKDDAADGKSEA